MQRTARRSVPAFVPDGSILDGANLQTCPREGVAAEKVFFGMAAETAITCHHMMGRVRHSSANHHPSTTKYLRR
jgi:hypothetical protein